MTLAKEYSLFLGSMFVTVLASQATMVVDATVGGNLLGAEAVSAVDLVMPVYELAYSLVMMLGMGGCTIASILFGRGEMGAVLKHFKTAIVSTVVMLSALGALILLFKDVAVQVLCGRMSQNGASELMNASALVTLAQEYLVALVPYLVISGVSAVLMMFTAMAGRPVLVLWCAVVQFAVNVTCNCLLIKVAGLGIEALAYSSALASLVTLALLLPYYLGHGCPFIKAECSNIGFWKTLIANIHYGCGFFAVSLAYTAMVYLMNVLVLRFEGEQGEFVWSVVMMIYITGDYASVAAQETNLSLGGRLLGSGDKAGFRIVYYRSAVFLLGWIGLILTGVFFMPRVVLPLFGCVAHSLYPCVMRAVAFAIPLMAGVSIGNLFLVRLVQKDRILMYIMLEWALYLAVPLVYLLVWN